MYYDDNFGEYDINDPEDVEFYHEMQRSNVWKNCSICGRAVKIQPQYDKCDSCCRILERGGDPEYCDPADYEPLPTEQEDPQPGPRERARL